ncbi:MAG: glycoside hydrolase family 15 protein [Vulcanimicrobiaceae bacterium]
MNESGEPPGGPGIAPTWTSSAKDTVGTSLRSGRVWFTLGFGILNEVYYPHVDVPQIRDLGFIVADDAGFWVEVKRLARYTVESPEAGIPAYTIEHSHERFRLRLRICPDGNRDALLVAAALEPTAANDGLRLYALLAPHLGDSGSENRVWLARDGTQGAVCASRENHALALAAVDPLGADAIGRASCGYVGTSDGWQDFQRNGRMSWSYPSAGPGNVAAMLELPSQANLALAFASDPVAAATLARASLASPFDEAWARQVSDWRDWLERAHGRSAWIAALPEPIRAEIAISAMVLKVHEDKVFRGATVASLSIPWGQSRGDSGGYHLVWARDLVESAFGLLAFGSVADARAILAYLIATQTSDGHWYQNQWLGGRPYWGGIQLDETGFPILLAAALASYKRAHDGPADGRVRAMVARAAAYIAKHGPLTEQDRWEEDPGLNPFTLAVCIAALVCAADFLDEPARSYALELADLWNGAIERWTYVRDGELAERFAVEGYYVRTTPPQALERRAAVRDNVPIKNRPPAFGSAPAGQVVGLEFLQLVRMGLRRADDPRIVATVKVVDGLLEARTPSGSAWHRYPGDGYGEHADGSPFDGCGIGRAWPLLAGERGHYACALGADVAPFREAIVKMTSDDGMIPEQVWESAPIPERMLFPGRPSGSANPLVWAHAEFVKLCASESLGHAFDRPAAVWKRYAGRVPDSPYEDWRFDRMRPALRAGKLLRIEVEAPARVHYSLDDWQTVYDLDASDRGLGLYVADLPTSELAPGGCARFTFYWTESANWEGTNFEVVVAEIP